jgi:tungstate transport system ATP-binding protein
MGISVQIAHLTKRYNQKMVLQIPQREFAAGKITGILGSNGSGKTTLLQIVAGLDKSFDGVVTYDGQPFSRTTLQNVTLVFQRSHLFNRSVYENLAYPLKIRHVDKATCHQRILVLLNRLDIRHLMEQNGLELSGGEEQKVSLARAMIFHPQLLLLDEPTSNIDPDSIRVMEREILRYRQETGGTVILVTHNMEQAGRLCDELVYLQNGKIEEPHGFYR